jgi:hypothetical protein
MGFFSEIVSATVKVALTPIAVVKDAVMFDSMPDEQFDKMSFTDVSVLSATRQDTIATNRTVEAAINPHKKRIEAAKNKLKAGNLDDGQIIGLKCAIVYAEETIKELEKLRR